MSPRLLEARGLQLPLNPDLGNLTMGAAAVACTKDSSMPGGYGQLSSYLKEVKLVLPSGKPMTINESQPDLLKLVRSSYGLVGVAHELTFKVVPLRAVRLDYETYTLEAFAREFAGLCELPVGLKFYLLPFRDRVTVEIAQLRRRAAHLALRHLVDPQVRHAPTCCRRSARP